MSSGSQARSAGQPAAGRDLEGRTAVVTGSARGIGYAMARAFVQAGARVVIQDLRPEAAEDAARTIESEGGTAIFHPGDISDPATVDALVGLTVERFGTVDILVNNAGFQHVAPIEEFPLDMWRRMIDVQLTGAFLMTKAVIPYMKRQGWGRIINMSSVNGKIGAAFKSAYCTAKHGLIGLTRVAALELAECGITVNAICPGYTDTPLVRNQLADLARNYGVDEDEVLARVIFPMVPQKRLLTPQEIADCAVFLASERAFGITGQAINVSAGLVMH